MDLTDISTRYLYFAGKGGVGKTTISCATAIVLADKGRRSLLVGADPVSNLDEILGVRLGPTPSAVPGVHGLDAMDFDPELAAMEYRERIVGPYRGVLSRASGRRMDEQLPSSCPPGIDRFGTFSGVPGDPEWGAAYDHVIFDMAPTGLTLSLLSLPHAWSSFMEASTTGSSRLGRSANFTEVQGLLYERSVRSLADPRSTTLVLVSRPELSSLREAERLSAELRELGVSNQYLVLNGLFRAAGSHDPMAAALEKRGQYALAAMPAGVSWLPRQEVRLNPRPLLGVDALRTMLDDDAASSDAVPDPQVVDHGPDRENLPPPLVALVDELERPGRGVIVTMGKGGVGKTTIAAAIALELVRRGHLVHLGSTDPAGRHSSSLLDNPPAGLDVGRFDDTGEAAAHEEVNTAVGSRLDEQGHDLLVEGLRLPCTEEIAVFRAFARSVAAGRNGFVVLDTGPTGHRILLLDAVETYQREVLRELSDPPETTRELLSSLRDPELTRILLVTLPEAIPVHEAARLQNDLSCAKIFPFAWVINQALSLVETADPVLRVRKASEANYLTEVSGRLAKRAAIVPWLPNAPVGTEGLRALLGASTANTSNGPQQTVLPENRNARAERVGRGRVG